ncbi:hypothetical protein CGH20_22735 [Vibrio parahaemolyticus]|nr:hypothetical protein CGH63_24650 [Vibrio parahaemolyticus]TOO26092.1 hypothetical protein CGH39_25730 [Vibrio parahaemolyticus]TOP24374.1 hypothetical protein CGH20_22735 [Vibrio parahaemolyticus]
MEVIKKESNKGAVSKLMSGEYRLVDVFGQVILFWGRYQQALLLSSQRWKQQSRELFFCQSTIYS